ncbi:MAG: repeat protein [Labilithrix sp.]|nr:repeat protein [Labilithrix sp.]
MNLWDWVNDAEERLAEAGHKRLAELIDRIPSEVCDDHHDRVDALVPEALALAKGVGEPWLEVFLKHWSLQSKVLHRMDGRALGEAVSLVELAHREETRACPQSVCAVQDLAAAYGFVDGAGYAEERKEVARETLARIDTSWSCFTCISGEYAGALLDEGDFTGALAYVERQGATLVAAGKPRAVHELSRSRLNALVGLERWQEALDFVAEYEKNGRDDEHHQLWRRLDRARLFAELGRPDEGRAMLPPVHEILPTPLFYEPWTLARLALIRAGALANDSELGATLQRFVERLEQQGVGRTTLELAHRHGELALERGAPHVARRALGAMERAAKLLHRPLGALDRIAQLRAAIDAAPGLASVELPETEDGLDAALAATDVSEERALLLLEAAHTRFPASSRVATMLFSCLMKNGLEGEALATLEAFHERTIDNDALLLVGHQLTLRPEHRERLVALAERHRVSAADDASRSLADWLLARSEHAQGRWRECLARLDAVLAARPSAINARIMYAEVARRLGDHAAAVAKLDEVLELGAEPGPADWDRMTSAAILGDWARVRHSASRIGYQLEGEGPIDERMGTCRIQIDEDGGTIAWARRISPVTARIVSVAPPPRTLRYLDVVAFDATPQNAPPATEEERAEHTFIYPYVATLSKGGYRAFEIDGVHPGDRLQAMEEAMEGLGVTLRVLGSGDYQVGEERGLYAALAVPADVTDQEVCAKLEEAAGDARITFTGLARAAGNTALAERHAALHEELGL